MFFSLFPNNADATLFAGQPVTFWLTKALQEVALNEVFSPDSLPLRSLAPSLAVPGGSFLAISPNAILPWHGGLFRFDPTIHRDALSKGSVFVFTNF